MASKLLKKKTTEKKGLFGQEAEDAIVNLISSEYTVEKNNAAKWERDFDACLDMLEGIRAEKDYDWMSDINMPEFASMINTDASMWSSQYFQTRDFVEVYMPVHLVDGINRANAQKKVLNTSLNRRGLYYYQKYMRARLINALNNNVVAKCWWVKEKKTVTEMVQESVPVVDENGQVIGETIRVMPKDKDVVIKDHFDFDVIDPRNVVMSNKYTYSIQEKDWVTFRSEQTYDEILSQAKANGYINLDVLKDKVRSYREGETTTSSETYNNRDKNEKSDSKNPYVDVFERFGKVWAIVEERDKLGRAIKIKPGLDRDGLPSDNAELVESIVSWAVCGSSKVLIRFQPSPYVTSKGVYYKPLLRGLCYIHPTSDRGLGDGQYARDLQVAINDTINIANDRVKMATLPTLIGREDAVIDNKTIYFAPEHVIQTPNGRADLEEIRIDDNVDGALAQVSMFRQQLQQVLAVYPTTMGAMPEAASTTATAISGAESRSNMRSNYKSLTFEHTFLTELYWLNLQMTDTFAEDSTFFEMLGEDAEFFNPDDDATYVPVSSNIETEYSKRAKIMAYDQVLGRIAAIPNPNTPKLINYIVSRICEIMGDEFETLKDKLLDESVPMVEGGNPEQVQSMETTPASNQNGVAMGGGEMVARDSMNTNGGGMLLNQ